MKTYAEESYEPIFSVSAFLNILFNALIFEYQNIKLLILQYSLSKP